ncbi:MAG: hypothetical protein HN790_16105 [Methylococcales bacterium]|nr:hypothetical protein [Methylococcales bacterium]
MTEPYSFLPDRAYANELLRPWKLVTFCISMSWLLYGAIFFNIGDWDIGVTLIMGSLTYLMSPWSVHIILSAARFRPRFWFLHIIAAVLASLFVVDSVYMMYHTLMDNLILREANFHASFPLYFLAGAFWLYRGSLKELWANIRRL